MTRREPGEVEVFLGALGVSHDLCVKPAIFTPEIAERRRDGGGYS